jgi:hypothetical protein
LNVIGGALGDTHWENLEMHWEAIVEEKSVSHDNHSVWQGEASVGGIWRYRDNGDRLSNREYTFV